MVYIKITDDNFTQKLDKIEYALYENLWLLTIDISVQIYYNT